jgi:DNA replication protein DnaC
MLESVMALSNAQYETIIRGYENRQTRNRHLEEKRLEEIYSNIPRYQELDTSPGKLALSYTQRLLEGDEDALGKFGASVAQFVMQKKELLRESGYPEDYLDPIYDCPDCKDTGYLESSEDSPMKCHCFREQEIALLVQQSNLRSMLQDESFKNLSYQYYEGEDLLRFKKAVEVSRDFVYEVPEGYRNLFFYGTVGTGKSFLSGCIAREMLEKRCSVIYFSAVGLFDALSRYAFDKREKDTFYSLYRELCSCDLFIIDDLGTEVSNSFVTSQLFSLCNERHLGRKATIISTNLNLEELRNRYSERIFSRITSYFEICKLSGPDIRMYKKRMANRK